MIFRHSGNVGDIIYALPAVLALSKGVPADLCLDLEALKGVNFPQDYAEQLATLLRTQDYIDSVTVGNCPHFDVDLDLFRRQGIPWNSGCIVRWYLTCHACSRDLSEPWLKVEAERTGAVVIARSPRYRNDIDYGFLRRYHDLVFVGLPHEWQEFERAVPTARWAPTPNLSDVARVVAGARMFVGNQSFPFALAEAMKVPRLLEVHPPAPNVIPCGAFAYDSVRQELFEQCANQLHTETA